MAINYRFVIKSYSPITTPLLPAVSIARKDVRATMERCGYSLGTRRQHKCPGLSMSRILGNLTLLKNGGFGSDRSHPVPPLLLNSLRMESHVEVWKV